MAPPALSAPIIVGSAGPGLICATGIVTLFQFIQPPQPGSVIGVLTTLQGLHVPLVLASTPAGGATLASVDRSLATVCGNLVLVGGQVALAVRFVTAGF